MKVAIIVQYIRNVEPYRPFKNIWLFKPHKPVRREFQYFEYLEELCTVLP